MAKDDRSDLDKVRDAIRALGERVFTLADLDIRVPNLKQSLWDLCRTREVVVVGDRPTKSIYDKRDYTYRAIALRVVQEMTFGAWLPVWPEIFLVHELPHRTARVFKMSRR